MILDKIKIKNKNKNKKIRATLRKKKIGAKCTHSKSLWMKFKWTIKKMGKDKSYNFWVWFQKSPSPRQIKWNIF